MKKKRQFRPLSTTLREFKTEGNTQFAIPVDPNLSPEDYIIVGRIITHQFIQCGTFPVRLAKASVIQMLFGAVDDDCLIDSFLKMFPPKERNTLQTALSGHDGAFPALVLLDILEDYGIKDIPSPKNIKSLLLGIANTELVAKPYFCLQKLKEGMGTFWQEVTSEEIGLLYDVPHPTAERVIASLVLIPQDEKEQQIYRWLQRYLSCSSEEIIVNFLRFCTAMDVILPHVSIAVDVELMMPGVFVRPKAFTCFKKLILPRNYQSFYEMRNNLDKYLRDPLLWDLAD